MSPITLFYRKKYPTAFSIERLFEQLGRRFEERGRTVRRAELPFYNNRLPQVWKNIRWARAQVQGRVGEQRRPVKHITGDVTSIVFGFRGPTVITIHDCNPLLRYPRWDPRYWFYRWVIYEWPARRADAVTVISEKTRRELLALTSCRPDNIHVIPNFIDPAYEHSPRPFRKERPTILHVGITPTKNLARLAEALAGIPCRLEIVGKPKEPDMAALERYGIDFHWETGLSDEAVRQRYTDCDLLAFVSTYEGFGLPILEAQMTGRPVLTSAILPHTDVAGPGGALTVDPHSVTAIREGVLRLLSDEAERDRMVAAGRRNVIRYGIDAVTDQYLALYDQIS